MPRKIFVAGEILTAADVNTNLMDQAVMVFDDSGARGSAIPSPSEGMVTYLKDSDQLFKYTDAWVPAVGLVAVKSALKTDAEAFTSVAAGGNVVVTGLSITHTLANASNKLLITAFFGAAANSHGFGNIGLSVTEDTVIIGAGVSSGSRSRVSAGGVTSAAAAVYVTQSYSVTFLYEPGDTSSHTYDIRAVNLSTTTRTLYINREEEDTDNAESLRALSGLIIQEVAA